MSCGPSWKDPNSRKKRASFCGQSEPPGKTDVAERNILEIAKLLLHHSADHAARDFDSNTHLHYAAWRKYHERAALPLETGKQRGNIEPFLEVQNAGAVELHYMMQSPEDGSRFRSNS